MSKNTIRASDQNKNATEVAVKKEGQKVEQPDITRHTTNIQEDFGEDVWQNDVHVKRLDFQPWTPVATSNLHF
jgi:hypothetical protein